MDVAGDLLASHNREYDVEPPYDIRPGRQAWPKAHRNAEKNDRVLLIRNCSNARMGSGPIQDPHAMH